METLPFPYNKNEVRTIYYTDNDENTMLLLDAIKDEISVPILEHNLTNPQREGTKASTAVAFSLIGKKTLITPEMGFGKTYIAMGLVKEILQLRPNKKILFCGPNDKLIEFYNDFKHNLPEYDVVYTNAGERDVKEAFRELKRGANILICGHSVWNKGIDFHKEFIPMADQFSTFVLDEGGMVLKSIDSYAYRCMEYMVPRFEFKYILNATPIERDLQLLINQCRVLGIPIPSKGQIYREYGTLTNEYQFIFNDLDQLKERLKYHMFNVSRSQLDIAGDINFDIDVKLLKVPLQLGRWLEEHGVRNLRYPFFDGKLFNETYYPSLTALKDTCIEGAKQGDKMLVYIRNVAPKVEIKKILERAGLSVGIYDGTHTDTSEKKFEVEQTFNSGYYDVLLTNKLYGLSLPAANHVIMYNLPPSFFQYIFRAIRTLGNHDLKLTAVLYDIQRDWDRMRLEENSERYQNEFVDRGFTFVSDMNKIAYKKRKDGLYENR